MSDFVRDETLRVLMKDLLVHREDELQELRHVIAMKASLSFCVTRAS